MKKNKRIMFLFLSQLLIATPIFASTISPATQEELISKGVIQVSYLDHENDIVKEEVIERKLGKVTIYGKPPTGFKTVGETKQSIEVTEDNLNHEIEFSVEDTQTPKGKSKNLILNLGEKASPEDFVVDITDNSNKKVDVSFKDDIDFTKEGNQAVKILLTDYNDNITTISANLTIVNSSNIKFKSISSEFGKKLTVQSFIDGKISNGLVAKFETEPDVNKLGKQTITIILSGGKEPKKETVTLTVVDTIAPTGKITTKVIDIEDRPSAYDLVENVKDNANGPVNVSFKERPKWGEFGKIPVVIILSDESGNKTELKGSVNVTNKDAISADTREVKSEAGEKVAPKKFLLNISNSRDYDIEYDKEPNFRKVGKQQVSLNIYDRRGYKTELKASLNIVDTISPKTTFKTKEITIPLKGKVDITDFIEDVTDNSDAKINAIFEKKPDTNIIGKQKLKITISDPSKNKTTYDVILNVVDPISIAGDKTATILISPKLASDSSGKTGTYVVEETKKQLKMDSSPILENGRVLVPVSNIARVLNVPDKNIDWNSETKTATILKTDVVTKKEFKVAFILDSNMAVLNGQLVQMEVPAKIIDGRTYVPLKYAMDGLGITNYKWDSKNKQVVIVLENLNEEMYKIYK